MLKDRGNKNSWKGGAAGSAAAVIMNPRAKKKSYGNIHSINDRGIHEVYESLTGSPIGVGGSGGGTGGGSSAPSSPWSSPLMGRKSIVTLAPQGDRSPVGKLLQPGQRCDEMQ